MPSISEALDAATPVKEGAPMPTSIGFLVTKPELEEVARIAKLPVDQIAVKEAHPFSAALGMLHSAVDQPLMRESEGGRKVRTGESAKGASGIDALLADFGDAAGNRRLQFDKASIAKIAETNASGSDLVVGILAEGVKRETEKHARDAERNSARAAAKAAEKPVAEKAAKPAAKAVAKPAPKSAAKPKAAAPKEKAPPKEKPAPTVHKLWVTHGELEAVVASEKGGELSGYPKALAALGAALEQPVYSKDEKGRLKPTDVTKSGMEGFKELFAGFGDKTEGLRSVHVGIAKVEAADPAVKAALEEAFATSKPRGEEKDVRDKARFDKMREANASSHKQSAGAEM